MANYVGSLTGIGALRSIMDQMRRAKCLQYDVILRRRLDTCNKTSKIWFFGSSIYKTIIDILLQIDRSLIVVK